MHISLTPELQEWVKAKVASGLYNNASEVVREALRFMEMNQDLVVQMKLDRLRAHLAAGASELVAGKGIELRNPEQVRALFSQIKQGS